MADLMTRREPRALASLTARLRQATRGLLDRVPTECPLCLDSAQGGRPCRGCLDDIRAQSPQRRCAVCGLGVQGCGTCPDCDALDPRFDQVMAAFDYAAPADLLIQQLKNSNRFQQARFLAAALSDTVLEQAPESARAFTILLPVPSSRQALQRRGFNPAGEIARQVAARLRVPYRPELLLRVSEGVSQKTLGRMARVRAQSGLYRCTKRVDHAVVAVVDDVLTTGATLDAVAAALKQAGAAKVVGLVAARTPYRHNK